MIPLDYSPRSPPRWRRLLRWLWRLLTPRPLMLTPLDGCRRCSPEQLQEIRRILEKMAREN